MIAAGRVDLDFARHLLALVRWCGSGYWRNSSDKTRAV
jgi:hypothetical protein